MRIVGNYRREKFHCSTVDPPRSSHPDPSIPTSREKEVCSTTRKFGESKTHTVILLSFTTNIEHVSNSSFHRRDALILVLNCTNDLDVCK